MRLFSFGGYGLALSALALVVFGAIECPPKVLQQRIRSILGDDNHFSVLFFCFVLQVEGGTQPRKINPQKAFTKILEQDFLPRDPL